MLTASAPRVSNDFLKTPELESQQDTLTIVSKAKKKKKGKSARKRKAHADEVPFPDDPFAGADPFDIAMAQAER